MNKVSECISIVHIGARDGFLPITYPAIFDDCCKIILFDVATDAEKVNPMLADGREPLSHTDWHKLAAWENEDNLTIFNTLCPYAAGAKKLLPEFSEWYVFGNGDCDYILGEAHIEMHRSTVKPIILDNLKEINSIKAVKPTIICIDAQGCSLEILKGATQLLDTSVDVVICEVELISFYSNAPSFGDVLTLLSQHGLRFSGFLKEESPWANPVRMPIGLRSKPLMGSADAVFIRDPRRISGSKDFIRLSKYAFSACICGHLDLAIWPLLNLDWSRESVVNENKLNIFINGLIDLVPSIPNIYPMSFVELSQKNQEVKKDTSNYKASLYKYCLNWIYLTIPILNRTPIEKYLQAFGFKKLADEVRLIRIKQTHLTS